MALRFFNAWLFMSVFILQMAAIFFPHREALVEEKYCLQRHGMDCQKYKEDIRMMTISKKIDNRDAFDRKKVFSLSPESET